MCLPFSKSFASPTAATMAVAEYASGVAGEIAGLRSDAMSEPGNPPAFILFNRPEPREPAAYPE